MCWVLNGIFTRLFCFVLFFSIPSQPFFRNLGRIWKYASFGAFYLEAHGFCSNCMKAQCQKCSSVFLIWPGIWLWNRSPALDYTATLNDTTLRMILIIRPPRTSSVCRSLLSFPMKDLQLYLISLRRTKVPPACFPAESRNESPVARAFSVPRGWCHCLV